MVLIWDVYYIKKIGRVFSVRWIASSYRAVKTLWNNHQALYIHFNRASENLAFKKLDRQQFKGLADKLSTQNFIEGLSLLKDCLAELSTLSVALQERSRNIVVANKQIKWTVNALIKMKGEVNNGKYNFNKLIGENPVLKEVPLHEYLSRSGCFSFNKGQFVQAIIDNISSRMLDRNNENILKDMNAFHWKVKTP